jgi:hypothetical protein
MSTVTGSKATKKSVAVAGSTQTYATAELP